MSFAIRLKATDFVAARWIERHIPLTTRSFGPISREDIDTVQADGHELQYIEEHYKNVPIGPAVVQKWTGEWARFIFDNLPY